MRGYRWDERPVGGTSGVVAGARFFFFTGLHNGLQKLHVVDVERTDGILASKRLGEEFPGVCQWHN